MMELCPQHRQETSAKRSRLVTAQEPTETDLVRNAQINHFKSALAPILAMYFPLEVWMMIISQYSPCAPLVDAEHAICLPNIGTAHQKSPRGQGRCNTLRSLSQTCKALRDLALPLLWEEVETCVHSLDNNFNHVPLHKFTEQVLRERSRSLSLSRTSPIATHVR